jgi:adenosylcobinamide kinase / adenosylcobinamide-phosphate guanylyltransferase
MSAESARRGPHLVLGGARSGKSNYAESLIAGLPPPHVYLATARVLDGEMNERVKKHRERRGSAWETVECPCDLTETMRSLQGRNRPVLVDCLTLWLTNLILGDSPGTSEQNVVELCEFLREVDYPLVLVSNEVGFGIVPDNPLGRRFRDLAGLANQLVAAECAAVTLVVAGIPLSLKG